MPLQDGGEQAVQAQEIHAQLIEEDRPHHEGGQHGIDPVDSPEEDIPGGVFAALQLPAFFQFFVHLFTSVSAGVSPAGCRLPGFRGTGPGSAG